MAGRIEEYKADSIIIKEGENKHRMYIVLEGEVILYSNYNTENEYIIEACGKGKTFGEFNLFSEEPYMFTAVAYNYTKLAWFEKHNLDEFINGYPRQAANLIETISKSYLSMVKNLHRAIDEINMLKAKVPEEALEISDNSEDKKS